MSELTPEVLADLRKLAEAAGIRKWTLVENKAWHVWEVLDEDWPPENDYSTPGRMAFDCRHEVYARFIAAANPAAVLSLLDQVEALQARAEKAEAERDHYRDQPSQWHDDLHQAQVRIAELEAALKATLGRMMNAKFDLQGGTPKRFAMHTLQGGIDAARQALAAQVRATPPQPAASVPCPAEKMRIDAERWRALVRVNPAQETDLSSGPGTPKVVILNIDVSGCERWDAAGAPDFKATLEAALDDEIANRLPPQPAASVPCPTCRGRKMIDVPVPPSPGTVKAHAPPSYKESGVKVDWKDCPVCHGTGVMPAKTEGGE